MIPRGDWQVGDWSPDGKALAAHDKRIQHWLTDRGVDYRTVYRVRLYSRGGWVYRYSRDRDGHFFKTMFTERVARKVPKWVAE